MKKILLLGGGIHQVSLAKEAIKRNLKIYLIDFVKKPYLKKYSNDFFYENLRDKNACLKIAKKIKPNYIITDQNDNAMETYSYLCAKLKKPGIPTSSVKAFTNKYLCKKKLLGNSFTRKFISNFNIITFQQLNYKFHKNKIIKPVNMQGSFGVFKIKKNNFRLIQKFYKSKKIKNFLIENYITGQNYAIESFVLNHKVFSLTISRKIKFNESFIDKKILYLSDIQKFKLKKIIQANKKIVEVLKLKNGLVHAEFKIDNKGKIFLIEIACRGGGSGITSDIIPNMTTFNPSKFLIDLSTNSLKKNYKVKKNDIYGAIFWSAKKKYQLTKKIIFKKYVKNTFSLNPMNSRERPNSFSVLGKKKHILEFLRVNNI